MKIQNNFVSVDIFFSLDLVVMKCWTKYSLSVSNLLVILFSRLYQKILPNSKQREWERRQSKSSSKGGYAFASSLNALETNKGVDYSTASFWDKNRVA